VLVSDGTLLRGVAAEEEEGDREEAASDETDRTVG